MAPPNLKKLLAVKIKPRQDSYSDQFSRILMVKMMMLTAAVTGITWMKDKITCVVPKNHDLSPGFVSKACWINGLYIYRDTKPKDMSYYYGIPGDITKNGYNGYGALCRAGEKGCKEMDKTFYLQYQWFPLAVAALAFLYYLPYLLFRIVNADIRGIKDLVKDKASEEVDYEKVIQKYFDRRSNSISHLQARLLLNIIVKLLYIAANIVAFIVIDNSMNGEFVSYGTNWSKWTSLDNEKMHEYMTERVAPKAGFQLLPGFAICQVASAGQHLTETIHNVHVYVCELSQHVLYQYILIVIWYMFILGIIVSLFGLLKHMYELFRQMGDRGEGEATKQVYSRLTLREKQYMDFVKRKNFPAYTELVQQLQANNKNLNITPSTSARSSYSPKEHHEKESFM